jgi:hypothetical protein
MEETCTLSKNYAIGTSLTVLDSIHEVDTNIAIYKRNIVCLSDEIESLLSFDVDVKATGDLQAIEEVVSEALDASKFGKIIADVKGLLQVFSNVAGAESYRLFLGTVNTNMCRKFHTDINDLRMLCTYIGPGTLWLKEDNINRRALVSSSSQDEDIVVNQNEIQQVEAGSALILKGAIYPKEGTRAIVHRSPTVEESGERRLLLRIDTNEFLNF